MRVGVDCAHVDEDVQVDALSLASAKIATKTQNCYENEILESSGRPSGGLDSPWHIGYVNYVHIEMLRF